MERSELSQDSESSLSDAVVAIESQYDGPRLVRLFDTNYQEVVQKSNQTKEIPQLEDQLNQYLSNAKGDDWQGTKRA